MLVPLIPVLQKLDYSINQQYSSIIISSKEGQQYELNLEDLTLYKSSGKNINCLKCPPGSHGAVCVIKGNDVILDTVTLHSTLFLMDSDCILAFNYHIVGVSWPKNIGQKDRLTIKSQSPN